MRIEAAALIFVSVIGVAACGPSIHFSRAATPEQIDIGAIDRLLDSDLSLNDGLRSIPMQDLRAVRDDGFTSRRVVNEGDQDITLISYRLNGRREVEFILARTHDRRCHRDLSWSISEA